MCMHRSENYMELNIWILRSAILLAQSSGLLRLSLAWPGKIQPFVVPLTDQIIVSRVVDSHISFADVCSIRRIKLIGPNLLRDPEHFLQLAAEVPQLSYLHVYNGVIGAAALHTIASNFPFLDHLVLDGGEWKASDFTNVAACLRMSSVRQLTLINQTLLVDRTVNGMLRAYFADAIDGENHQGDVSGRLTVVRLQQCPRLTRTGVQSRPCVAVIHVRRHGGGDGVTPHSARRPFRPVGVGCVSPDNTTDWPTLTALAARTTALPSPVGSDTRDKTGCPATPAAAANTDWSLIS
eukprot:m.338253 g.338253  ORF g.338253 m.338253 type:complete len:294 (+) comp20557_c0_seq36:618-1499(+)